MINNRAYLWIFVTFVLLAGCDDQRILEKTGFIHSTSFDLLPDGKINYAISVPIANPEIKTSREFLSTVAKSSKEGRINLAKQTNLTLVSGQLRTALFGLSLAKKGIWDYMDTLMRDPTISEQAKIIVVNGDAKSLLERNYRSYPRTGRYIDRLIQKEAKGHAIPLTTIYTFVRDYYDDGIDPIVPIIKNAGETLAIDGIALFKDDKYVGKIKSEDALIFSFIYHSFKHGELSIDLKEEELQDSKTVMLSSLNSSKKVDVKHEESGQTKVIIHANVTASILEYVGELKLSDDASRRKLEREISDIITQRAERIIKYLQDKKTDSLGIGTYVRNSMTYSGWKETSWHDKYPNLNVQVKLNVRIKEYGFRH
ncbi:Ger(x)C family spore germination protein [Paenibacillus puerhi]|uniref:Ger(x)C family spore germination protein n=1 Tax=Paenibacillus puerhi TaxID=2692622 RepID=UPI001357718B|nr:Ger(x)C family spore germination protein [Paenibacillus puerhi]